MYNALFIIIKFFKYANFYYIIKDYNNPMAYIYSIQKILRFNKLQNILSENCVNLISKNHSYNVAEFKWNQFFKNWIL